MFILLNISVLKLICIMLPMMGMLLGGIFSAIFWSNIPIAWIIIGGTIGLIISIMLIILY